MDLRMGGRDTQSDNIWFFFATSSSVTMNRIEMLIVGTLRREPTLAWLAKWALHRLDEILAHIAFLIAAASIRHHPSLGGRFNVRDVNSSHLFYCKSVEINVHLSIFHCNVSDLAVEVLHLRGRVAFSAGLYSSPQNALTDFWRDFFEI